MAYTLNESKLAIERVQAILLAATDRREDYATVKADAELTAIITDGTELDALILKRHGKEFQIIGSDIVLQSRGVSFQGTSAGV